MSAQQIVDDAPKTDEQVVRDFISNPENREMAINLASQIKKEMGDNWFSVSKFLKTFKSSSEEAKAKFIVLGAFNLVAYKEEKNKQFYKIDMDQRTQRIVLLNDIAFHEAQIKILKQKLSKLD